MATTRKTTPGKKPGVATRVPAKMSKAKKSTAEKKVARKSPAKKALAKKPTTKKPIPSSSSAGPKPTAAEKKALKEAREKMRASADKAKATKAANMRRRIDGATRVDATDEAGTSLVAKANAPWQLAADRIPETDIIEPAPSPRIKRTAVDRAGDPPPATGIALVERVTRAVERELSQIEVIVGGHHVKKEQRTEAERRARTLASLARTLTEVRRLRPDENKLNPRDDDTVPRDINAFRLELARKLDRLAAEAQALYPGEPDGAGER